jgi:hypothetical protein
MEGQSAQEAAAATQAAGLKEQLAAAEAASAARKQQLEAATGQLQEAQQALIDADRCVSVCMCLATGPCHPCACQRSAEDA